MNLLRELVTFEPSCENCVRVSFTYDGQNYTFDVPRVGDNEWMLNDEFFGEIKIVGIDNEWILTIADGDQETSIQKENDCPFGVFPNTGPFGNLTVTPCTE